MIRIVYALSAAIAALCIISCNKDPEESSIELYKVADVCALFEDAKFKNYCYKNFDKNKDGKLSMEEAAAVESIDIEDLGATSIEPLAYFINLSSLNCSWNQLTSLDVSNNTALYHLECKLNPMTTLYLSTGQTISMLEKPESCTIVYK